MNIYARLYWISAQTTISRLGVYTAAVAATDVAAAVARTSVTAATVTTILSVNYNIVGARNNMSPSWNTNWANEKADT